MAKMVKSMLPTRLAEMLVENGLLRKFLNDCDKYPRTYAHTERNVDFYNRHPDQIIWILINPSDLRMTDVPAYITWSKVRMALLTNQPYKNIFNFYKYPAYVKDNYRGEPMIHVGCQTVPVKFVMEVYNDMQRLSQGDCKSYAVEEPEDMRITLFQYGEQDHLLEYGWNEHEEYYMEEVPFDSGELTHLVEEIVKFNRYRRK